MTKAVLATVYCANSLMPYPVTSAPGLAKDEGSGPDVFGPGEFGAVPGRHRTISVEMYEITRSNSVTHNIGAFSGVVLAARREVGPGAAGTGLLC